MTDEQLKPDISGDVDKLKTEKVYLCSRCHSANPKAAEDHADWETCCKSWQTLTAQSLAAVEQAKRKIAHHQKIRHMGFKLTNPELNLCTRCLIIGFSAYQHLAGWFATFPKNQGKGGLIDVSRFGRSPMPRPAMRKADPKEPLSLLPPLGDAPGGAPDGDRGGLAAGDMLPNPASGDGVGEGGPRGS